MGQRDRGKTIDGQFRKGAFFSQPKNRRIFQQSILKITGIAAALIFLALLGCSKSDSPTTKRSLCQGKTGFAAQITGTESLITFCLPDDSIVNNIDQGVQATYNAQDGWYLVEVTGIHEDMSFDFNIGLFKQTSLPASLTITGNLADARSSQNAAWFFYRESKLENYVYSSVAASGELTMTFTDTTILVGTFSGVSLTLEDEAGSPAGERSIGKGFIDVSIDN